MGTVTHMDEGAEGAPPKNLGDKYRCSSEYHVQNQPKHGKTCRSKYSAQIPYTGETKQAKPPSCRL